LLDGPNAPKEGDIKLKDERGNWMIVEGVSIDHLPLSKNSVTAAILDSGVAADHPQLKGLIAEQKDFTGEGIEDRIGHGTIVTIRVRAGASDTPIRFIIGKVARADGTISKEDLIAAINWAAQRGARVVNMSLGFREDAVDYSELCFIIAKNSQIVFVAAAGNFGPTVRVYPAACHISNLIAVATPDDWSGRGDIIAPGTVKLVPLAPNK